MVIGGEEGFRDRARSNGSGIHVDVGRESTEVAREEEAEEVIRHMGSEDGINGQRLRFLVDDVGAGSSSGSLFVRAGDEQFRMNQGRRGEVLTNSGQRKAGVELLGVTGIADENLSLSERASRVKPPQLT